MKLEYCDVTQGPAEIVKSYIDVDFLENKIATELHSGVDIKTTSVYSVSPGLVKLIGNVDGKHVNIFIQSDDTNCYNYCHMKTCAVEYYDAVELGTYLGEADEFVHFEYLNTQRSRWPFRIGTSTWYKHNPEVVLTNGYLSNYNPGVPSMASYGQLYFGELTHDWEFENGRGDD